MTDCQKSADGSGAYCCDNDSSGDCCNDTSSTFIIRAVVTSVATVSQTNFAATPSSTASKSASTNTPTASPSAISSSSGVKVGVGVGVGVGALIIIALALGWFLRRRRIKDQKRSGYGGPNEAHEIETLKKPDTPSELAHDRTTEVPAELAQGQNRPVEMDSGTGTSHLDGASNEQPFLNPGVIHPHRVPNEPSSLPAPSQDSQRTVRPAFSTSSIVHPGLLDAAATASKFLNQENTAPAPAPSPEPSAQQARSFTRDEASAPLSPDENPLLPFPPKSSSKSHLPPPLSANQPSPAVADRLNPPTAKRPFHSAPPTPRKSIHQIFSTAPRHPAIQVVPPTPQHSVKYFPSLLPAEPVVSENGPSIVKAMQRGHPQPLQSSRPLSFATPPSTDGVFHGPYPADSPLRGSSMAGSTLKDLSAANGAHQGLNPAGTVRNDSSSTDYANFQSSTHNLNAPDSTAIRNYSHKLTKQQSQQFRDGTRSAHVENMAIF